MVPVSDTGKIVTLFYALPGIAVNFATYTSIAIAIIGLNRIAIIFIEIKLFKQKLVKHINAKTLVCHVFLAIATLCSQAALSSMKETENYRYLDAVYFVFAAITTIGFGDFNYKFEKYIHKPHLFLLSATLNSCGLGLVASIVTTTSEMMSAKVNFKCVRRKSWNLEQIQDDDDNCK